MFQKLFAGKIGQFAIAGPLEGEVVIATSGVMSVGRGWTVSGVDVMFADSRLQASIKKRGMIIAPIFLRFI